ncbi:MAG: hypothetical protein ACLQVI_04895 [Polyangiaceae bacterium]
MARPHLRACSGNSGPWADAYGAPPLEPEDSGLVAADVHVESSDAGDSSVEDASVDAGADSAMLDAGDAD